MKRLKRVTKRKAKEMKKFLTELAKTQIKPERPPVKVKGVLSLTEYLKRKAMARAQKLVHRQEKRELKAAEKGKKKPEHTHVHEEGHAHEHDHEAEGHTHEV